MYGNLNYKTTCFGLWRPSSGLDPGTLKWEKSTGGSAANHTFLPLQGTRI